MYKKVNELITLLENSGKCEVKLINREKHNYAIETMTKLPWKRHSRRFGKIQAGENRLRIDLEVPGDSVSLEEINNAIKLPHKDELSHTRTSHFGIIQNGKGYDTVVLQIYRKDLDDFAFEDTPFASFVNKVIEVNTAK